MSGGALRELVSGVFPKVRPGRHLPESSEEALRLVDEAHVDLFADEVAKIAAFRLQRYARQGAPVAMLRVFATQLMVAVSRRDNAA